jgi:hypothetical protein
MLRNKLRTPRKSYTRNRVCFARIWTGSYVIHNGNNGQVPSEPDSRGVRFGSENSVHLAHALRQWSSVVKCYRSLCGADATSMATSSIREMQTESGLGAACIDCSSTLWVTCGHLVANDECGRQRFESRGISAGATCWQVPHSHECLRKMKVATST